MKNVRIARHGQSLAGGRPGTKTGRACFSIKIEGNPAILQTLFPKVPVPDAPEMLR